MSLGTLCAPTVNSMSHSCQNKRLVFDFRLSFDSKIKYVSIINLVQSTLLQKICQKTGQRIGVKVALNSLSLFHLSASLNSSLSILYHFEANFSKLLVN